jgi:hypothetical protein
MILIFLDWGYKFSARNPPQSPFFKGGSIQSRSLPLQRESQKGILNHYSILKILNANNFNN